MATKDDIPILEDKITDIVSELNDHRNNTEMHTVKLKRKKA